MSRKLYGYSALLATSLLAISLAGCGTDKKEGFSASSGGVGKVDEALCAQCHRPPAGPS